MMFWAPTSIARNSNANDINRPIKNGRICLTDILELCVVAIPLCPYGNYFQKRNVGQLASFL